MIDGIVADEQVTGLPALRIDTLMDTPESRERVARRRWTLPGRWPRVRFRPAHRPMRTLAVLPVKGFAAAKARLAARLEPGERAALAEAMLGDVLAALRRGERAGRAWSW